MAPADDSSLVAGRDPAWPAPPDLHRMLYWDRAPGKRPQDHVRSDVSELSRRQIVFLLQQGRDAHPGEGLMGWASCRICGAQLGSGNLTAFGFVWPEKAEHYVITHDVWTPDCTLLLQCALAAQR